jgi:hypothetical protein
VTAMQQTIKTKFKITTTLIFVGGIPSISANMILLLENL